MNEPDAYIVESTIERAEAILDRMASMGYDPSGFRIDEFVRWLEGLTGREIQVVTVKLPFDLSGFWVTDDEFDYICCDAGHPPFYTDHVVTHEALHIFHAHLFPECKTLDIGDQVIDEFLTLLAASRDIASQVQSRHPTMPWDDEIEWATVMVRAGLGLDQSPASSNRHVEEYIKITRLD